MSLSVVSEIVQADWAEKYAFIVNNAVFFKASKILLVLFDVASQ